MEVGIMAAHVSNNTGEYEWYTPIKFIEAAREVMGDIDLDPASCDVANTIIKAKKIYTIKNSGLTHQWEGRIWMNPPYKQPLIMEFSKKLSQHVRSGKVSQAIVLVNNATETAWFRVLTEISDAICFPTGRVKFWAPNKKPASPLQGQAILYIGHATDKFFEKFSEFGTLALIM